MTKKAQFSVIIVKSVAGNHVLLKRRKLKEKKPLVKWGEKSFPIDLSRPIYRVANRHVYLVDIEEGQLLVGNGQTIEPIMTDMIFRREIVRQMVAGLGTSGFATNIANLLIGAIMGILGGYIIGQFVPMG